jgi:hypothetical protein
MPFEVKQIEKPVSIQSDSIADPSLVIYGLIAMLIVYIFRNVFIGMFLFLFKIVALFGFAFLTYKMFLT